MPSVSEALQRLERELVLARQDKTKLLKLVHGYGSTGQGGDIRIAVQKRLVELAESGHLRACIFGEDCAGKFRSEGGLRLGPRQSRHHHCFALMTRETLSRIIWRFRGGLRRNTYAPLTRYS